MLQNYIPRTVFCIKNKFRSCSSKKGCNKFVKYLPYKFQEITFIYSVVIICSIVNAIMSHESDFIIWKLNFQELKVNLLNITTII